MGVLCVKFYLLIHDLQIKVNRIFCFFTRSLLLLVYLFGIFHFKLVIHKLFKTIAQAIRTELYVVSEGMIGALIQLSNVCKDLRSDK